VEQLQNIEDVGGEVIQVDFANKMVGGEVVMSDSASQVRDCSIKLHEVYMDKWYKAKSKLLIGIAP